MGYVMGVGINDAPYPVTKRGKVEGKYVQVWVCPFYKRWKDMLKRCYSEKFKATRPTYKNTKVCKEWLLFSNFKSWMEEQSWKGNHLDKDIKGDGSIYSPHTCIFILPKINVFVEWTTGAREYPVGVSWCKEKSVFRAFGRENGHTKYLGQSTDSIKCQRFWIDHKIILTQELLNEVESPQDREALSLYMVKLCNALDNNVVFVP